ncbi:MAG: HEAT repeat domain-containing protein [Treponema sp.]|nr:HEAT repeat domain-containing protein [Treponema sp.]
MIKKSSHREHRDTEVTEGIRREPLLFLPSLWPLCLRVLRVKFLLSVVLFLFLSPFNFIHADESDEPAPVERTVEDRRRDTLRFGTETEIATLIQTIRTERYTLLDDELIEVAENTRNRSIFTGIFGYFGEMEKSGLEERAMRAIRERDYEVNDTVTAAISYLGRMRAPEAVDVLRDLVQSAESRFLNTSIRALGRAAGANPEEADSTAEFLLEFYNHRSASDEARYEIIVALGETGSSLAVSFLIERIMNDDERAAVRMAALDAMAKIGDEEGLPAVIFATTSTDPNVRSSAVAALGPFPGEEAERAVLEAFRDSNFRARIGAAQAAGRRQLESAIPFLRFRAENDDVVAVREESIKALGAINNSESMEVLDSLFSNRRASNQVRLVAAEMLLNNDPNTYSRRVFIEMQEAQRTHQTPLYNGFVRLMSPVKSTNLEDIVLHFMGGGVIEKALALDMIMNNEIRSMEEEVRSLLDERRWGVSLARRAERTLEVLGLTVN